MSSLGIALVGFVVWAHHMFTSGMNEYLRVPFMYSTLLVAVPTGVKFFSWVATLMEGEDHNSDTHVICTWERSSSFFWAVLPDLQMLLFPLTFISTIPIGWWGTSTIPSLVGLSFHSLRRFITGIPKQLVAV